MEVTRQQTRKRECFALLYLLQKKGAMLGALSTDEVKVKVKVTISSAMVVKARSGERALIAVTSALRHGYLEPQKGKR